MSSPIINLSIIPVRTFRPSIIRATCTFDAKKRPLQTLVLGITYFDKSNKDFLQNSDFTTQLSAFLIEISERVSIRNVKVMV